MHLHRLLNITEDSDYSLLALLYARPPPEPCTPPEHIPDNIRAEIQERPFLAWKHRTKLRLLDKRVKQSTVTDNKERIGHLHTELQ